MGYDIYGLDDEEIEIAHFSAYMGCFRMMRKQGFDWFLLIDATDADGGVSGRGKKKTIARSKLEHAKMILMNFDQYICNSRQ